MQCPRCKCENLASRRFCGACGAPLPVICGRCGFANAPTDRYCGGCGDTVAVPKQEAPLSGASAALTHQPEHRQLTVMFVDMVGSTALSRVLDPEEMNELLKLYRNAVAGEVARFDGHVTKFMGDGILAYFGWPVAHEDDAERAVRAGFASIESVARLRAPATQSLAARVGVATGLVVVGELIGEKETRQEAAVGQTPTLATHLQSLAAPGAMVISGATRRLLGQLFKVEELGAQRVEGFGELVDAWRVISESGAESRFEALHGLAVVPLIGRDHELALLIDRWRQAKAGEGQVVLLAGEAGIGKSRLVLALREHLRQEPRIRLRYQCSSHHISSALWPVVQQLERAAGFERTDTSERKLEKLEALLGQAVSDVRAVAPLIASLLSIDDGGRYPSLNLSPQAQRARTLSALVAQLEGLAAKQPVLMVLEDAHWLDPTSIELFEEVVARIERLPVLLVVTFRPEFKPPWAGFAHVSQLSLNRLSREQGSIVIAAVARGKQLPQAVLEEIVAKTDGVPLFLEEFTKSVLESGLLRDVGDRYELEGPLPPLAIPSTLHDSLIARLDRLPLTKEVGQIAACIGREFSHKLLVAVAQRGEPELQASLDQLVQAQLIFRQGARPDVRYMFKHALVRDAAYKGLLKSRRRQIHARIAAALEDKFPDAARSAPQLVAEHYTTAELWGQAIGYWLKAGQLATARSALAEATAHLHKGLELLAKLPDLPERGRIELDFQLTLGACLTSSKGFSAPEVQAVYDRALELCQGLGDASEYFAALHGMWWLRYTRGDAEIACNLGEQLLRLAERRGDTALRIAAHRAFGYSLTFIGNLTAARDQFEQGIALYDPETHGALASRHGGADPGVACLAMSQLTLWALGYPDQALRRGPEALAIARRLAHPMGECWSLLSAAMLHQLLGEPKAAQERADAVLRLATEQAFELYIGWATPLAAWEPAVEAENEDGIARIRHGIAVSQARGSVLFKPYWLGLVADAWSRRGHPSKGLEAVAEGLAEIDRCNERLWEAELLRLKGELLLRKKPPEPKEAEAAFSKAIDVARRQQAKSWELRAATSLSRLWAEWGDQEKAVELLAPIVNWFTNGIGTSDLRRARELLDETAR
jgi:class 3 adenylate cyclase/predicted ATPase